MTPQRFTPPDQEEVEREVHTLFRETRQIQSVASLMGMHRSQLSRYLNPEHPDKSPVYLTFLMLEATRYAEPAIFERLSDIVLRFLSSRRMASGGRDFCVKDLTEAINNYFDEAPKVEQLAVTRRAIASLQARERELMENDLEDSPDARRDTVKRFAEARV